VSRGVIVPVFWRGLRARGCAPDNLTTKQNMAKSTAAQVFPLFPHFPFEIRRAIYLLATPARFVYVWEFSDLYDDDDPSPWDEFVEYLGRAETLGRLKLHPSLTYFAHNWRDHVHWGNLPGVHVERQTRLTSYGFKTRQSHFEPWTPTPEKPEVPIHWLVQQPELAFQFARSSYLRSTTAIPPLLHTCSESRQVLIRYGYELAFGTRTCGPRTWFCYRHDVLYLYPGNNTSQLLDTGGWNLGQFLPYDLTRVRCLALCPSSIADVDLAVVSSALRLVPGLVELFVVVCNLNAGHPGWLAGDGSPWLWIEGCDVGVRGAVARVRVEIECNTLLHVASERLTLGTALRESAISECFGEWADEWAELLRAERDKCVGTEEVAPWKIPKVRIGFLGSKTEMRMLYSAREDIQSISGSQEP